MVQIKESTQEFRSLAGYLLNKQESILKDWEMLLEDEDQVSQLITLSREKFRNHVPIFIEILSKYFYRENVSPGKIARKHGAQRWEHGFDLRETVKEWSRLHGVLINYVNSAKDAHSLSYETVKEAQKIVTELIHKGIQNSVDEFYKLQNREAEAQVQDLEMALSNKKFQDENLQQTSHDLKGILSSLQIGFSLLKGRDFDERTTDILEEMSIAADSLEQLLNNLLDLFRLEAGQEEVNITSFNAAEMLNGICDSLRPLAEAKNLELKCPGKAEFSIEGDRNKIQRITQNLLINALKYTNEGYVEVGWSSEPNNTWQLKIADSGPGLSSTYTDFLTMESDADPSPADSGEERSGEGIGLLIVRRLCKLLKAVIEIDTAPNEGTTFRILFPRDYTE